MCLRSLIIIDLHEHDLFNGDNGLLLEEVPDFAAKGYRSPAYLIELKTDLYHIALLCGADRSEVFPLQLLRALQ